jgi:type II secretory pathway pseudopilin PulG
VADPEGGPGRRRNDLDRDRIRALAEAWELAVARLERRYSRVAHGLVGMMLVGILAFATGAIFIAHQQRVLGRQQKAIAAAQVRQREQQKQIQEGRKTALRVVCSATSAVIEAGRKVITGGAISQSTQFERNLRRLGYPPIEKRKADAAAAADSYANLISLRIARDTGVIGLVRPDGTLDCTRLLSLAQAP